jgi:hypothetical protein
LLCDLVHVVLRWQAGADVEELVDALRREKAHRPPEEAAVLDRRRPRALIGELEALSLAIAEADPRWQR